MGQYDEAVLALKAYLDLAEINLKVKTSVAEEVLTHEQRVRLDIESEYDIITVMVEGAGLYLKTMAQPKEALSCAERALSNIRQYLLSEDVKELTSNAYKYQGIAYSQQASEGQYPCLARIAMIFATKNGAIVLTKLSFFTTFSTRARASPCSLRKGDREF